MSFIYAHLFCLRECCLLMHQRYEVMEELRASLLFHVRACAAGYTVVTVSTYPSSHPSSPTLFQLSAFDRWLLNSGKHQTHMFGSENSPAVDFCPSANWKMTSWTNVELISSLRNPVPLNLSTGLACLGGDEFWGGTTLQTPEPRTWREEEAAARQQCRC